jgi:chloramphenicol-sensitive protein RarD
MWGLFPLYLRGIASVPPPQIIAHRIVWCSVFVLAWLAIRREFAAFGAAFATKGVVPRLAMSALMVSINWLVYVWAVQHGHVVDASLGYFINPLVSVLLGVVVLHERLNRAQKVAVALAAAGVVYLLGRVGRLLWTRWRSRSFGMYGPIRKVVAVDAVPACGRTVLLTPLAGCYPLWCQAHGSSAFGLRRGKARRALVGSGLATAVPLAFPSRAGPRCRRSD